ncbi:hypothetical protein V3C99_006116 [Haemonchus contortus]
MLAFASGVIAGAVLYHYCTNKKEVSEHSPGRKQTAPPTQNVKNAHCRHVPAEPVTFNCQTARSVSMETSRLPSSSIRTANPASTIRTAERPRSVPRAEMSSPAHAPAWHIPRMELISLSEEMVATAELPEPEILTAIQ